MRILIKGGVWKNTEDEILKAAVMKYGLNQWARISSLLVRKSAKQCKARWYEWLDPAIKKTEWTHEEDEKLLHLAKLMPTQWRTIAPIVGRTPTQCLDRYEKLLDMAAGKEAGYDPRDDPRRLRPGEIDPNPESKPARPDPIDMDEDEKEMLSEARARLANTRGKKAKRKARLARAHRGAGPGAGAAEAAARGRLGASPAGAAGAGRDGARPRRARATAAREKQLEEARRLATLQKKRELKAAGIEVRERPRRYGAIDYSSEVAFERKPAPGFYDTTQEVEATKNITQEFRPMTIEELEGRKRRDIEQALMKADAEKAKRRQATDAPAVVARAIAENEAQLERRRGKMMLPAPQITEAELEAIARAGDAMAVDPEAAAGGSAATRALLGDYATPARFATPMRTPARTPAGGGDRVMQEAQNLMRLQTGQTPLLGGDNPELHPSDFSGVTPRAQVQATPNPLAAAVGATPLPGGGGGGATGARSVAGIAATPLLGGAGAGAALGATGGRSVAGIAATPSLLGATPGRGGLPGGATPGATPMRDALGLNDPDAFAAAASKREEAARLALMRNELRAGLSQLPAPKNEYQIVAPELPEEEVPADFFEEDAADRDARRRAAEEARRAAELRRRSQVMQRGLPRPATLDLLPAPRPDGELGGLGLRELAQELLAREVAALIGFEAAKFPLKEKKASKAAAAGVAPIEEFELEELAAAARLLAAEAGAAVAKDILYIPSQQQYARAASATNTDRLAAAQVHSGGGGAAPRSRRRARPPSLVAEFEGVRKEMEKEAKRAAKLEQKVAVVTGGLAARQEKLRAEAEEAWQALASARMELTCFRRLHEQEQRAAPDRIEALQARGARRARGAGGREGTEGQGARRRRQGRGGLSPRRGGCLPTALCLCPPCPPQELVAAQQARERSLQEQYKQLTRERDDALRALQAAAAAAQ
eukprot:scaffold9.g3055.t1